MQGNIFYFTIMQTPIDVQYKNAFWVHVFTFEGELDETNADKTFTAIYSTLGDFINKKIIFNLAGLKYLNSKSIGYIADIYSNIEDNSGIMFLSNIENVRDTLELVGIPSIVTVYETEEEALERIG